MGVEIFACYHFRRTPFPTLNNFYFQLLPFANNKESNFIERSGNSQVKIVGSALAWLDSWATLKGRTEGGNGETVPGVALLCL